MACLFSRHDSPCNFYLWGGLKNAVYKTNPCSQDELKHNIHDEINNIIREGLERIMGNFIKRYQIVWTVKVDSSSTSVNKVGKYNNL